MKNYDVNIDFGKAVIEITLQTWQYKGHYRIEMQGNVKGTAILETAFDTDWLENKDIIWNDCKLNICENLDGEMIYRAELESEYGNTLEIDGYTEELKEIITGVRIVEFVSQEER